MANLSQLNKRLRGCEGYTGEQFVLGMLVTEDIDRLMSEDDAVILETSRRILQRFGWKPLTGVESGN